MPFNITTGTQSFSVGSNSAAIQNWNFNPPNVAVISSINASNNIPVPQDINITVRDFLASSFASTHSSFILQVSLIPDVNAPNMVALSSSTHTITGDISLTAGTSLDMVITATFGVMSVILEGTYNAYINLKVLAANDATGLQEEIDLRAVEIRLDRTGTTINELTPRDINLSYVLGSGGVGTASFDILPALNNGQENWRILHLDNTALTISNNSTTANPFGDGTFILGSGAQTGTIALTNDWENKPVGLHSTFVEVFYSNWGISLGININVQVFSAVGAVVTPSALQFFTSSPDNPAAQQLDIFATGAFTIVAPSWLQLSATSGTGAAIISVEPIDVSNFSEGEYFDNIIVTVGSQSFTIPVYYQVNDDLDTNLEFSRPNFTLDGKYVSISGYDTNHYLQVETTGISYDMNNNPLDFNDTVKVPFFKAKATYVLGKVIQQAQQFLSASDAQLALLNDIPVVQLNGVPYSTTSIKISVVDRRDNTVRYTRTLEGVIWVPGTTPLTARDYRGLLSYKNKVSRITPSGKYFFNVYSFSAGTVTIKKNDVVENTFSFPGGNRLFKRILIQGGNYVKGDRVSAHVNYFDENGNAQSVDEYLFIYPEQEYSRLIAYLTPYNTVELLECTGQLTAGSQYIRRSNTVLRNGVSVLKHVDTNRDDNLYMNTGFIPEDQRAAVDVLLRSDQAWLIDPVDGVIEITVSGSELSHSDSEKFLHAYDLEFNINRQQDAQIHLF